MEGEEGQIAEEGGLRAERLQAGQAVLYTLFGQLAGTFQAKQ